MAPVTSTTSIQSPTPDHPFTTAFMANRTIPCETASSCLVCRGDFAFSSERALQITGTSACHHVFGSECLRELLNNPRFVKRCPGCHKPWTCAVFGMRDSEHGRERSVSPPLDDGPRRTSRREGRDDPVIKTEDDDEDEGITKPINQRVRRQRLAPPPRRREVGRQTSPLPLSQGRTSGSRTLSSTHDHPPIPVEVLSSASQSLAEGLSNGTADFGDCPVPWAWSTLGCNHRSSPTNRQGGSSGPRVQSRM